MTEAWYFRDHDNGAWGVRMAADEHDVAGDFVVTGLDKSVAAAIACLLSGDIAGARSLLAALPERIPSAND
jgi:hypothetical protein